MKTEAIRLCIQQQYGKEDYDEARKELSALEAENARLTADAKLNDMAWNDNQAALNKQAAEIIALKKACIVYHNQIINMQKEEEE